MSGKKFSIIFPDDIRQELWGRPKTFNIKEFVTAAVREKLEREKHVLKVEK